MAWAKRTGAQVKRSASAPVPAAAETPAPADTSTDAPPATIADKSPPSSLVAGTNLMIADIVLRSAGSLLRKRAEKGLLAASSDGDYDKAEADRLIDGRSLAASVALWGASRIATRSPLGLVVVAGGLAAKLLYDRGKRLETNRRARKRTGNNG
ncbi:hypothetical protein ABIE62_002568 [Porphyrobacter sp. MBR-155]|jgi:hypothetical protein|uniref:hypothetical protein n=1 Tax=Porphyrobacter sp. MBR-155 TaxID=3156464 RepID=UPI00339552FA